MTAGILPGSNLTVESSCSSSTGCSVNGVAGFCIDSGCCSGTSTAGYCSGASNIQCCTQAKCTTPVGSGTCVSTSSCKGTSYGGYCYGPSNIQCCVSGPVPAPVPSPPSSSVYGVDMSTTVSTSSASCFASTYKFAIPRGYTSVGSVDTSVCTSIKNLAAGGVQYRDTYMFPCPTCSSSASSQVNQLVSYIKSYCASQFSGRIWLDIEGSQYWSSSHSTNQNWYKSLVDACNSSGYKCGVYSSSSQWSAIFGSTSFSYGSNLPLWYAHYDGKASFTDYTPFGGWSSPYAKQYQGDVTKCSMGVDLSYSPNYSG